MLEHQWSRLLEYGRSAHSWGPEWTDAAFSADNIVRLSPSQTSAEIRAWARANGIAVPARGRIPAAVRDSYAAAQRR